MGSPFFTPPRRWRCKNGAKNWPASLAATFPARRPDAGTRWRSHYQASPCRSPPVKKCHIGPAQQAAAPRFAFAFGPDFPFRLLSHGGDQLFHVLVHVFPGRPTAGAILKRRGFYGTRLNGNNTRFQLKNSFKEPLMKSPHTASRHKFPLDCVRKS